MAEFPRVYAPPVFSAGIASVPALTSPPVAIVRTGPIGPAGAPGHQGQPGANAHGFCSIDYANLDAVTDTNPGTPITLAAGQWVRIVRNLAPSAANLNPLSGPWTGFGHFQATQARSAYFP